MVGALVKLAGQTVAPFNGRTAYVKAVIGDRWIVVVTLETGERREIGIRPHDALLVSPPPTLKK
jgi:hypothetical protein